MRWLFLLLVFGFGCIQKAPEPEIVPVENLSTEAGEEVYDLNAQSDAPLFLDIGEGQTPDSAWQHVFLAAMVQDCKTIKKFSIKELVINDQDCQELFNVFDSQLSGIEPDWEATEYLTDQSAIMYTTDGKEIVSLRQEEGIWKINKKFWK